MRIPLRLVVAVLACFLPVVPAVAQFTPSADSYTLSTKPNTNYGSAVLMFVAGSTESTYIQFDLSAIPAGPP
jgi:hypothetical protein